MENKQQLQEKRLKAFYSVAEEMRQMVKVYKDKQLKHLHSHVKKELKQLTFEKKKLLMLLKKSGIAPFYLPDEKRYVHRSNFGKSWVKWLSSGTVHKDNLFMNDHELKFDWKFFGTLTAGFETITAKGIIRLTEKYLKMI